MNNNNTKLEILQDKLLDAIEAKQIYTIRKLRKQIQEAKNAKQSR
jgi:hypothetical protein